MKRDSESLATNRRGSARGWTSAAAVPHPQHPANDAVVGPSAAQKEPGRPRDRHESTYGPADAGNRRSEGGAEENGIPDRVGFANTP